MRRFLHAVSCVTEVSAVSWHSLAGFEEGAGRRCGSLVVLTVPRAVISRTDPREKISMADIDPDDTEWMIAICDRLIDLYLLQEAMTELYSEAGRSLQDEIDDLLREIAVLCPRAMKSLTLPV
jgi:hypothetical protein